MMFKFLLALTTTLAFFQVPVPTGTGGGTGWQSGKGGTVCTRTRLPNGRLEYSCDKR